MPKNKNKLLIFGVLGGIIILVLIFVFGFLLKGGDNKDSIYNTQATLSFWSVGNQALAYQTAINRFNQVYPNVKINYRRFNNVDEYEGVLLDALAAGEGPDIFVIRNNDLPRKFNKIFPLPTTKYSVNQLKIDFPETVKRDFAPYDKIYALPVSVDTLALIYNEDLFNRAAIVFPPKTWREFENTIPKLTKFGDAGEISCAGAAIGTTNNIENAKELISLFMMQSGAEMINEEYTRAVFDTSESREALNFYVGFSNSNSQSYTWDTYLPDSIEAFSREKAAIIFGTSQIISEVESRNSLLKTEVAEIPQIEDSNRTLAFARYFGYTVSRQTRHPGIAWDFVLTLTTDEISAEEYLKNTSRPPALKTLINKYKNDPKLGVFARQALIARSWREPDIEKVDEIFREMINAVRTGDTRTGEAVSEAAGQVTNLMK